MSGRSAFALLCFVSLLRLALAASVPLAPDEAYYWVWSRALAPGYFDHPPMVALFIRAGTALAGATAFGVRIAGPLAAAFGSVFLAAAGRELFGTWRQGVIAAALLNTTLIFGVGSLIITPDTPLILFWTATLWTLARLLRSGGGGWWLAAGGFAGLALDSDYTALLLVAGVGLWLLLDRQARPWLGRWQSWAGLALAALFFAPVFWWNARHGWASFIKQGGRVADFHPLRAGRFLSELVLGQFLLATPLVFVLLVAGMVEAWRSRGQSAAALLLASVLPGAAVFFEHALGDRVQGNWPVILYPGAALAAAGYLDVRPRLLQSTILLGAVLTALVYVQAVFAPISLPARFDPTLARLGGWPKLAKEAARRAGAGFLAADAYDVASELAFYAPPTTRVLAEGRRWQLFELPQAAVAGQWGLLLHPARRGPLRLGPPWAAMAVAREIERARAGVPAARYELATVVASPLPGLVLLPRP